MGDSLRNVSLAPYVMRNYDPDSQPSEGGSVTAEIDYRHTWQVSADSRYLRFIAWLYGVSSKTDLSFCSLFWGTLFAPIVLVLRPFGKVSLAALNGVAVWLLERSFAKEARTGKTWEQRHPHFDAWLQTKPGSLWNLLPYIIVVTVCSILLAVTHPIELAWYVPGSIAFGALLHRLQVASTNTRVSQSEPGFIRTAYHALKTRTCPRIEVVR